MSTALEINGQKLVPIKEAAKLVSYTRDYVARLAREGKIVASQVGRQWYVDAASLQAFATDSVLADEVRKRELSAVRKRERLAKSDLERLSAAVVQHDHQLRRAALNGAFAVLCVGLFTGSILYAGVAYYQPLIAHSPLERTMAGVGAPLSVPETAPTTLVTSASVNEVVLPPAPRSGETLLLTTIMEQPVFLLESETVPMDVAAGILVLPDAGFATSAAEIAALFSDPVAVELAEGGQSGTITLERPSGELAQVSFVRVPESASNVAEAAKRQTN